MDRPAFRKPKLYFDTSAAPSHVTFDDGRDKRRNLPWMHYVEARWDHAEPDLILIEIGDWRILLRGHNLGPLFQAIEEHALARVRAQPELESDREHEADTFVREITFTRIPPAVLGKPPSGQIQFDLG